MIKDRLLLSLMIHFCVFFFSNNVDIETLDRTEHFRASLAVTEPGVSANQAQVVRVYLLVTRKSYGNWIFAYIHHSCTYHQHGGHFRINRMIDVLSPRVHKVKDLQFGFWLLPIVKFSSYQRTEWATSSISSLEIKPSPFKSYRSKIQLYFSSSDPVTMMERFVKKSWDNHM